MNVLDILKYGHLTVVKTVDGLPEDEWETANVCGWWSSKEIIAHLVSFEQLLVEILNNLLDDDPMPTIDRFAESPQRFNDVEVARRQGKTPAEVWAEYEEAQARTMELMTQIPADKRRQKGLLAWYGPEYDLEDLVVYSNYGHKREHTAQIAVFLDQLDT